MRNFPVITAFCLCVGLVFSCPSDGWSQENTIRKSDLVRLLGELPEFAPIREDMAVLGFRGEKLDMAEGQIVRMLRDPLIAGNIADRVIAAQQGPLRSVEAGGLFWPLVDRGLGHLTARELRYFYLVEQTMLKALTPRECGLAVKEKLSPERLAKATGRVAARLNTPALKEYYRIQYKAARFGATREAARLNPRDAARVVEKINEAIGRELAGKPDAKALMQAFADLGRVGNRRACKAGTIFMDAVLSMKGRDLHQALILLSTP